MRVFLGKNRRILLLLYIGAAAGLVATVAEATENFAPIVMVGMACLLIGLLLEHFLPQEQVGRSLVTAKKLNIPPRVTAVMMIVVPFLAGFSVFLISGENPDVYEWMGPWGIVATVLTFGPFVVLSVRELSRQKRK